MHQPQQQPHKSSYFTYEVYPFVRPPEMDGSGSVHQAVVVGAGPVGLVLAIQLALNGVRCVLIEAEAQVCGGSRALAWTKRSMEIIEQAGVAERFLALAKTWREGRSYYKNHVVHHLNLPFLEDDKFEPMTNLAQCVMEKILLERARELGVDVRFQTCLVGVAVGDDGVTLTLDTPEGEYQLRSEWVVGCDGARSSVRRLQGLRFEGQSFESRFVIADFNIDLDEPFGRRCYFEPPWLPGHTALMHRAPSGVWRLDYQVPDDVSDEEALNPERIASHINAHLKYIGVDKPWTIEWTSLYKPNTLTLSRYNHGRVLYCGDAAHLFVAGVRCARHEHRRAGRDQPGLEARRGHPRARAGEPPRYLFVGAGGRRAPNLPRGGQEHPHGGSAHAWPPRHATGRAVAVDEPQLPARAAALAHVAPDRLRRQPDHGARRGRCGLRGRSDTRGACA
jgi:3-(3-hydroxy-phenyl)propionate hydroxylase